MMEPQLIDAILEGGPVGFPATERVRRVPAGALKVKIPYGAGYEHFERRELGKSERPVVYVWSTRTKVAE
ncbi:hypothetical protein SAMN06264365_11725 [Actinoplanes regularis]|uniref:Uncharacterized protein n=1 Tax=Actinoplanes regularis TaxID=52697 RepID=A0A239F383_9ACTN|nr:hypothetical protein Are01nite_63940 [Actinoplanes regularis]SNS50564.1 hypothetical protein SAMN06264365_11725 [Actinoplanes regularis]